MGGERAGEARYLGIVIIREDHFIVRDKNT